LKSQKTNPILSGLIETFRSLSYERDAKIWKDLSKRLAKGTRRMAAVNVGLIGANTGPKDQVAVPGKVLGVGELDHAVIVAGLGFTARAREKILAAGGECIGLLELADRNPKGSNVKLMV
jgi:large subunit ribosomal protein L18e